MCLLYSAALGYVLGRGRKVIRLCLCGSKCDFCASWCTLWSEYLHGRVRKRGQQAPSTQKKMDNLDCQPAVQKGHLISTEAPLLIYSWDNKDWCSKITMTHDRSAAMAMCCQGEPVPNYGERAVCARIAFVWWAAMFVLDCVVGNFSGEFDDIFSAVVRCHSACALVLEGEANCYSWT